MQTGLSAKPNRSKNYSKFIKQMKRINVLSKLVLRERISQSDILNKKAQKYILGGYGNDGYSDAKFKCNYDTINGPKETSCWMNFATALSFCDFWATAGYTCGCKSCYD